LCWGVHMQRMHERMTRARATRAHICANVFLQWCAGARFMVGGKSRMRLPRGVHTGSCVWACRCTAPRSGAPAGAPRSGAPADAVQAPRSCGARKHGYTRPRTHRIALWGVATGVSDFSLGHRVSGLRGFGVPGLHNIYSLVRTLLPKHLPKKGPVFIVSV